MLVSADLITSRRSTGPSHGATVVLAVVVVLLFPLVGLPRDDERTTLPLALSYFYAADAALLALALLAIPRILASARRARAPEAISWVVLFTLVGLAFAAHPSARGIDVVLRIAGGIALYRVVADAGPGTRRMMAAALGLTAIAQAGVAMLQHATGVPLGLVPLGELQEGLSTYNDGPPLARGTLGHEFILAALAVLSAGILAGEGLGSARPARWLVAAALAASSAGLVYGRTVAIAAALAWGSLLPPAVRDARYRWALAALILGAGIPAVVASDGWVSSFARGTATDRGAMVGQALAIAAEQPLVGVGPGRYLDALRARPDLHVTREPQNVHNVPLMVAAEIGAPAGIVVTVLLVLLAWSALRAGAPAATLYLAYVPWMVLDVLPYATPQGVVLTAVWLGFLRAWTRRPSATAR